MHNGTGPALLPFSRRPVALFFGLTAVILGILGMHILGASHHGPASVSTAHAASDAAPTAAGDAHAASLSGPRDGEQAASHGADAVQVLVAHPNEPAASMQGACTEPCSENQAHMGAMCILMIGGLLLLLLIPKELSLRRWDLSRLYGVPFGRTFRLPPAHSLHQLCISRT